MSLNLLGGSSVSLDIGSAAIRVIELKHAKNGKSQLVHYASVAVPATKYDGKAYEATPDDVLIDLIGQAINDAGISKKEISIGVPTSRSFSVIVDLPKIEKREEQEKVIPIQAEEHIPSAIDTVDLDWHVLGDSPVEQGKMEVLLTSIDKSYNAKRIELVQKAGLKVISVEPDAYALAKALVPSGSNKAHIIIESSNVETDLVIVINDKPRLVRTIPIGARHIVTSVSQVMSIDMAQAQAYVYKFGLNKSEMDGQVANGVQPIVANIVEEVLKSVKFIKGRYANTQFSDIMISGFAAFVPGIDESIQQAKSIPTIPGDAWTNVTYSENLRSKLQAERGVFAVPVGLARRMND